MDNVQCHSLLSVSDSATNHESSVDLIRLDVSRTFPHLGIFQKVNLFMFTCLVWCWNWYFRHLRVYRYKFFRSFKQLWLLCWDADDSSQCISV